MSFFEFKDTANGTLTFLASISSDTDESGVRR